MSGAGLIEMLAARLGGRGMRRSAPALREVLASAMPNRAPVTAYEPIASRLDDPMAEGAMLSGTNDVSTPMPNAIRTGPDAGPSRNENTYREGLRSEGFDTETPLFHGTTREFDNFDLNAPQSDGVDLYGRGVYLTSDADFAGRSFASEFSGGQPNIRPVFARLQNPLIITPRSARETRTLIAPDVAAQIVRDAGGSETVAQAIASSQKPIDAYTFWHFSLQDTPTRARSAALQRAGFDGIVADPNAEMGASGSRPHVVVFDPENIRSQHGSSSTAPDGGPVQAGLGSSSKIDDLLEQIAPINGAPPGVRFTTTSGEQYRVGISPGGVDESANVTFDRVGNPRGPFEATGGHSVAQAREIFRNVESVIRRDALTNGRNEYEMFSGNPDKARIYRALAERTEPPPGYAFEFPEPGVILLRRTGPNAGSDRNALQRALRERMERE